MEVRRRPWWCLVLFVPSLVASFLVGEGLAAALGYDGDGDAPLTVALAAGLPAIVVFASPSVLVWYTARRARQEGADDAWIPVVVALGLSGAFLAANLFQLVAGLVV